MYKLGFSLYLSCQSNATTFLSFFGVRATSEQASGLNLVSNRCSHYFARAVCDDYRPVRSLRIVRSTNRLFNEARQVIALVIHRSHIILDQGAALGRAHHVPALGIAKVGLFRHGQRKREE